MRKIFSMLTLALCIIFSATAFAEEAEDVVELGLDSDDNAWYMDATDVVIEKNSGGELIFRANFVEIFSEKTKNEIVDFYRKNGKEIAGLDSMAMCIETVHFREFGGKIYLAPTDMLVYNKNKEVINDVSYIDREIEWQPVSAGTIGEIMYQTARKYAK
ncbi:MAG: hypothetical protein IJU91_04750 [Selenomonadaceae bacterium]|nr:hypothetical protein [Selenomonadaceae bacterium]